MNTNEKETMFVQALKKQRLDKEFSWISREFGYFLTLSDLDVDTAPMKEALDLGLFD